MNALRLECPTMPTYVDGGTIGIVWIKAYEWKLEFVWSYSMLLFEWFVGVIDLFDLLFIFAHLEYEFRRFVILI